MGQFAEWYAGAHYRVLPLARGGKRPHAVLGYEGGVHHGDVDYQLIRRWWDSAPSANIGIACGQGLVVIDLDRKNGADGPRELAGLCQARGIAMPDVPWARTPSGGAHLWMRWPWAGGVPNRTGLLPGVDVKGDGGYVVVPPSGLVMPRLEAGQEAIDRILPYEWAGGCPCTLPAIPDGLGEWIATAPASSSVQDRPEPFRNDAGLVPGNRNNELSRLAASLFRRYGTGTAGLEQVTATLREAWEKMDNHGFPWSEVRTIITHARAYIVKREREEEKWATAADAGWLARMRPSGPSRSRERY
jgi:hypothetical protein